MDLSPDGSLLATTAFDGSVRVWDASTHELRHEIGLEGDFAKGLAFVDDSHFAIGTQGGLVAVLTLDLDELAEYGRSRLSRGFAEDECIDYLGLGACLGEEQEASD